MCFLKALCTSIAFDQTHHPSVCWIPFPWTWRFARPSGRWWSVLPDADQSCASATSRAVFWLLWCSRLQSEPAFNTQQRLSHTDGIPEQDSWTKQRASYEARTMYRSLGVGQSSSFSCTSIFSRCFKNKRSKCASDSNESNKLNTCEHQKGLSLLSSKNNATQHGWNTRMFENKILRSTFVLS